jgi:NADH:ubiquinone oxidoreductase subunit H
MFLSTRSVFVRRLSLVIGFLAAGYRFIALEKSWSIVGPPAQDAAHPAQTLITNVGDILIECGLFFLAAWASVRVIAWVIAGLSSDRTQR